MILTVDEVKSLINPNLSDSSIQMMLESIELLIRKYTNNNFQNRHYRSDAIIEENKIKLTNLNLFSIGDTIQISKSEYNDGLYVVKSIKENEITLDKPLPLNDVCIVTKIVYPSDVKMGALNMMKYDLTHRDKVGIQSETISRHSVTYFNQDSNNSRMGYPVALLGFLKPYMKARF